MAPRSIDLGNPFLESLDGVCEFLLVRHGEQEFDPAATLRHNVDAPLSELGDRQALAVGERLAAVTVDAVYASPLQRAFTTGQAIAGHHGLYVHPTPALAEIELWAGLDQDRSLLDNLGPEELTSIYRAAGASRRWDAYPYSEDPAGFRTRVRAAFDTIAAAHEGERVVVACHGGVINAFLAGIFGSPHDTVVTVHHTSISMVRAAGERRAVVTVNDFAHVLPFQTERDPLNAA